MKSQIMKKLAVFCLILVMSGASWAGCCKSTDGGKKCDKKDQKQCDGSGDKKCDKSDSADKGA